MTPPQINAAPNEVKKCTYPCYRFFSSFIRYRHHNVWSTGISFSLVSSIGLVYLFRNKSNKTPSTRTLDHRSSKTQKFHIRSLGQFSKDRIGSSSLPIRTIKPHRLRTR